MGEIPQEDAGDGRRRRGRKIFKTPIVCRFGPIIRRFARTLLFVPSFFRIGIPFAFRLAGGLRRSSLLLKGPASKNAERDANA